MLLNVSILKASQVFEFGLMKVGYKGREITLTKPGSRTPDIRINPFGGKGNGWEKYPHYHRRPGIGKHRPWERGF